MKSKLCLLCALCVSGGDGLFAKSCLRGCARQGPLPMGLSRQEYWSGLSFPSPGDLPDPGIESVSPALQADDLPTELRGKPCVCF